tara:strand:- start:492 stop:692 length:201 start_codon:yes stop_codon:yes gene_type:complete
MTKTKQAKRHKRNKAKRKNANMQQNGLSYEKKNQLAKSKKTTEGIGKHLIPRNFITPQPQSYGNKQ